MACCASYLPLCRDGHVARGGGRDVDSSATRTSRTRASAHRLEAELGALHEMVRRVAAAIMRDTDPLSPPHSAARSAQWMKTFTDQFPDVPVPQTGDEDEGSNLVSNEMIQQLTVELWMIPVCCLWVTLKNASSSARSRAPCCQGNSRSSQHSAETLTEAYSFKDCRHANPCACYLLCWREPRQRSWKRRKPIP